MTNPIEPIWITERLVRAIHRRQLAEHGGIDVLSNEELRGTVLARPRQLHATAEHCDKPRLAAAYATQLARGPALFDGNKRTAAVVCETFLELNGCRLDVSDNELLFMFFAVAAGRVGVEELGEWVRAGLG
jgi:death-on-curing protein